MYAEYNMDYVILVIAFSHCHYFILFILHKLIIHNLSMHQTHLSEIYVT